MRLLLVEDDELLARKIAKDLSDQHYVVDIASDGEAGWHYSQSAVYDLIMLDVSLPKKDGITLCRHLRQQKYTGAILLLTAHAENSDKIKGLDAGADDYVIKPCTIDELCARIRALLRRRDSLLQPVLQWGKLKLDSGNREVNYHDRPLSLSAKEYGLLELFIRHPRRIFSSNSILEHLWSFDDLPGEETVRAHIKRLRKKLKSIHPDEIIETVYGMGYRLANIASPPPEPVKDIEAAIGDKVNEVWESLKPVVIERLDDIRLFISTPDGHQGQRATQAAHKLAGSLGMFGYPTGSSLAREIETLLKKDKENTDPDRLSELLKNLERELNLEPVPVSAPTTVSVVSKANILTLAPDTSIGQRLAALAGGELQFIDADNLDAAKIILSSRPIDAILFDLALEYSFLRSLYTLEELALFNPRVPILVVSSLDGFEERLEVVRRGGKRYLSKSLSDNVIFKTIREVIYHHEPTSVKLMAVDDDRLLLAALEPIVSPWGIELTTVNDPRQFWRVFQNTRPDILLLDVEMPTIGGIEICQVIRQDHSWDDMPIVFLTSCRDSDTLNRIFNAGADDYIAKPFQAPELITRLFNRLERRQLLKMLEDKFC